MEEQNGKDGNDAPTGQPEPNPPAAQEGSMKKSDPVMVVLAYLGPFALIPYFTVKDDDFVRWHAKQGLTYFAAAIALWIALMVIGAIAALIPVVGLVVGALIGLVSLLLWLGLFALWVVTLVKALGGERWKIPLVGDLSERW